MGYRKGVARPVMRGDSERGDSVRGAEQQQQRKDISVAGEGGTGTGKETGGREGCGWGDCAILLFVYQITITIRALAIAFSWLSDLVFEGRKKRKGCHRETVLYMNT